MNSFSALRPIINKIIALSEESFHDRYLQLKWPGRLSEDQLWMSRQLLSVYGTPVYDEMSEEQLLRLAQWESVNFYSLNVLGIRELLIELLHLIHSPGYEEPSRYFHYFISEETEHMNFFSKFCMEYGGKIYDTQKVKIGGQESADIENFLLFARILIFEEIVDYYNIHMGKDAELPGIVRDINQLHHDDESRHISFNRAIVRMLFEQLSAQYDVTVTDRIRHYLHEYLHARVGDFYNPKAYRDAGFEHSVQMRKILMAHPARIEAARAMTKKLSEFMLRNNMLSRPPFT